MSKPSCTGVISNKVCSTNTFKTTFVIPNEVMHGNALLMTGVPIQAIPPDSNIYKYWYDTSSGKAVLKLHNGTSWIVVDFGAANVKVTGNQTIDGIKTFTSFPVTPSSEPTSNYQVANKKYVDENGSPAGTVVAFAGTTAPVGYLFCRGQEVSRTTYAKLFAAIGTTYGSTSGTTFKVPDLRGEFIRGFDAGSGIDSGRILGSWQIDEFKSHSHIHAKYYQAGFGIGTSNYLGPYSSSGGSIQKTENTGGIETRPRNVAMNYIIKY